MNWLRTGAVGLAAMGVVELTKDALAGRVDMDMKDKGGIALGLSVAGSLLLARREPVEERMLEALTAGALAGLAHDLKRVLTTIADYNRVRVMTTGRQVRAER